MSSAAAALLLTATGCKGEDDAAKDASDEVAAAEPASDEADEAPRSKAPAPRTVAEDEVKPVKRPGAVSPTQRPGAVSPKRGTAATRPTANSGAGTPIARPGAIDRSKRPIPIRGGAAVKPAVTAQPTPPAGPTAALGATKPPPRIAGAPGGPPPKGPAATPPVKPVKPNLPVTRADSAKAEPPLAVEAMMPLALIREVTKERRMMPSGAVPGITPTTTYNSLYFAAPAKGGRDRFGTALQVWKETSRTAANRRLSAMQRQYPNAQDTKALAPARGFYAYWGDMQTLTFVDPTHHTVVSVVCGEELCSQKALFELAKYAQTKL